MTWTFILWNNIDDVGKSKQRILIDKLCEICPPTLLWEFLGKFSNLWKFLYLSYFLSHHQKTPPSVRQSSSHRHHTQICEQTYCRDKRWFLYNNARNFSRECACKNNEMVFFFWVRFGSRTDLPIPCRFVMNKKIRNTKCFVAKSMQHHLLIYELVRQPERPDDQTTYKARSSATSPHPRSHRKIHSMSCTPHNVFPRQSWGILNHYSHRVPIRDCVKTPNPDGPACISLGRGPGPNFGGVWTHQGPYIVGCVLGFSRWIESLRRDSPDPLLILIRSVDWSRTMGKGVQHDIYHWMPRCLDEIRHSRFRHLR